MRFILKPTGHVHTGVNIRHAHPREARGAGESVHGAGERNRAARGAVPHTRVRAGQGAGTAAHPRYVFTELVKVINYSLWSEN